MIEFTVVDNLASKWIKLCSDDPVRPEIPWEFRVGGANNVFVLHQGDQPLSVVCCAYLDRVPADVDELLAAVSDSGSVAVYYTVWSYSRGYGREVIFRSRSWIEGNRPEIVQFMTLSPPTELARVFHTSNGAGVYRTNPDSVNYQYI